MSKGMVALVTGRNRKARDRVVAYYQGYGYTVHTTRVRGTDYTSWVKVGKVGEPLTIRMRFANPSTISWLDFFGGETI